MKKTDQTLLEQLRITDFDIEYRQKLLAITSDEKQLLNDIRPIIDREIDTLVIKFYEFQTSIPEIALVIGDADTLFRLRKTQRRYILDLFSGVYDREYVNNRLRIGLVHKRMGVEPKLYLAAIGTLKLILNEFIVNSVADEALRTRTLNAFEKLLLFDITLIFETYIRSLVAEIEVSKDRSEQYAILLEDKVRQRTEELERLSRTDALTGLLNTRHLVEILTTMLRSAERRSEPITLLYIDLNDFKIINDIEGHQRGDEVLKSVAAAIKDVARLEDRAFRYGGDEFCIVLSNCSEQKAREVFVPRLIERINHYEKKLTVSIGTSQTGPASYINASELIKQADQNMYLEKQSRRDTLKKENLVERPKKPKSKKNNDTANG